MYAPALHARSLHPLPALNQPLSVILLMLLGLAPLLLTRPLSIPTIVSNPAPSAPPVVAPDFGKLPLSFVPNVGQSDPAVKFQVSSMGGTLFFTSSEVVLSLPTPTLAASSPDKRAPLEEMRDFGQAAQAEVLAPPTVVRLQFDGANPAPEVIGGEQLPGIVNYFIGNDPAKWRSNLPTYAGIVYQGLYPGIDLSYDGAEGQMKGTYTVAPGVDPTLIRWRYDGASGVRVEETTGDLVVALPAPHVRPEGSRGSGVRASSLREAAPVAWQTIDGRRVPVTTGYSIAKNGSISFALGAYNRTQPLVIDPTLVYSTYLGGSGSDIRTGIAVDSAGNAYLTGRTSSANFPTANPLQATYSGTFDVFVAKLNAAGSALLYSTFLGGSDSDSGTGIAVDSAGNAYLTGQTSSTDFPTANPLQATYGGRFDVFVAKLNAAGSALLYSTFLGGSSTDSGSGIAVDSAGNAYLTGGTASTDFPTANPLQATHGGGIFDAFVTKLNAAGSALLYSTYLGGSDAERGGEGGAEGGTGIAVDSAGNAYLTGGTASTDFPTANPLQATYGGGFDDAFVTKLNAAGSALVYSTFLGGSSRESGSGIAVDSAGNAYLTGYTSSADFPTANPLQATHGGLDDAFVAKLNAAGSALLYSTFLGGTADDNGSGIAVDSAGNAYLTGSTSSADFPTAGPLQSTYGGGRDDAFVTKIAVDSEEELDERVYLPLVRR